MRTPDEPLDDQCHPTQVVGFEYPQDEPVDDDAFANAAEVVFRLCDWAWYSDDEKPLSDFDGLVCRTVVLVWAFSPAARTMTMTKIAGRAGKKKQSIGRAVDSFKRQFPELAKHLRHLKK